MQWSMRTVINNHKISTIVIADISALKDYIDISQNKNREYIALTTAIDTVYCCYCHKRVNERMPTVNVHFGHI